MKLTILGSSSRGNAYILQSKVCSLIIECGLKYEVYQKALNYDISNIVGVLVSHRHNDHALSISDFILRGIDVFTCYDVAKKHDGAIPLADMIKYQFGDFVVMPIKAYHDVECYSFLIEHEEMGRLLFITDTSKFPYKFKDINHIMIETNYDDDYKLDNAMDDLWSRSASNNHLSLSQAIDFVGQNKSVSLQNVIALHLSGQNIDDGLVIQRFNNELGIKPIVAQKGVIVELKKEEF